MRIAVCPGSFNPITNGHVDIITRAAGLFDHVIVAVLNNSAKKYDFTAAERVSMIRDSTAHLANVSAESFNGLLVDFTRNVGARAIVKGLRAVSDFEYEFQMALMNEEINPEVESIFLTTSAEYMFLSSSVVRELAMHGGDISRFVPPAVVGRVMGKYAKGVAQL